MHMIRKIEKQLSKRQVNIIGQDQMKNSAVILPLIDIDGELSVLFEVRSYELRSQPGDICFPGGKIDKQDASPRDAALRELTEELQIQSKHIQLLADLDILITPFKGIIYPFVAQVTYPFTEIKASPAEVDHLFTVPLRHFYLQPPEQHPMRFIIEPETNSRYKHVQHQRHTIEQYFYYYETYTIWGLTARILKHFIDITKP
ncbi:CoA pyrophosphatase [Halalkalibacter sp. APA_J-10(15)]|uniref:NUDIX hydrolase n=1 Tax=unclassified Halalkalibacter TaxID=2893063 RepID=UPI001FF67902|nr:CoA pyrophosphatase [Halalkalibacter sp. APA_J-10(15)]MCK0470911.1 CoA pyrophosphatase [Halalkalibacter sp. APA_J-10(15)]